MAKIAIALCILLVAYCTAQANPILDQISSMREWLQERIREELEKLEQLMEDAMKIIEEFREYIENAIQDAIKRWEEKIENITGTAEAIKTCASKIDFEAITDDVKSSVHECMEQSIDAIKTDYELTKAAFQDFVHDLNDAWESANKCSIGNGITEYFRCLQKAWNKINGLIDDSWNDLLDQVASLASDVVDLRQKLRSCAVEGVELLDKEWSAASDQLEECVANMDSNTAS